MTAPEGVTDTFTFTHHTCGATVHVIKGREQPHRCRTDARKAAVEAVAFHTLSTADESCCSCGEWLGLRESGPVEMQHAEHVASAVLNALTEAGWTPPIDLTPAAPGPLTRQDPANRPEER